MLQTLYMDQGSLLISIHQLADTVVRGDQSFASVAEVIREMATPVSCESSGGNLDPVRCATGMGYVAASIRDLRKLPQHSSC